MAFPAAIVEPAPPEALPEAEATVFHPAARDRMFDPTYHAGLERFGRELEDLTGPVWGERYKHGKGTPAPMKRQ